MDAVRGADGHRRERDGPHEIDRDRRAVFVSQEGPDGLHYPVDGERHPDQEQQDPEFPGNSVVRFPGLGVAA